MEGDPDWRRTFVPYNVVPHRNHRWWDHKLATYKREGQEWIIHQEYPRTAEEAFVKSGMNVFDTDMLMALEPAMHPPIERGYMDGRGPLRPPQRRAPCRIWQLPVMGASYVIGADVAEGVERGRLHRLHRHLRPRRPLRGPDPGHPRARWWPATGPSVDTDLYADALEAVGHFYRTALVGVERNGPGLAVVNRLRDKSYPRLYRQEVLDQRKRTRTERLGWQTCAPPSRSSSPTWWRRCAPAS